MANGTATKGKKRVKEPSARATPSRLRRNLRNHRSHYVMLLPAMLTLFVFKYMPMYGVQLAFKEFSYRDGIWGSAWTGLANFRRLFAMPAFRGVISNTLIISFCRILFTFLVPVVVAVLLNEIRIAWFKRTVQTVLYLPHFLSWVIISGIVYSILTINGGFVNKLIESLGGTPVNFLLEPSVFRPIIYITGIWKEVGWESIIYLAALSSINPELYEAAIVDGASRFRQMVHITWPGIKSTVVIMLILTTSRVMYAGFDQIFNLYSAPVYEVSDIIDTYVYREFFLKGNFGVGTAAGLFQSVINLGLVLGVNRVAKTINEGEGLF